MAQHEQTIQDEGALVVEDSRSRHRGGVGLQPAAGWWWLFLRQEAEIPVPGSVSATLSNSVCASPLHVTLSDGHFVLLPFAFVCCGEVFLRKRHSRRIELFSCFDRGIQLDDDMWWSVTPEQLADHTADRCRCDLLLDGFAGVSVAELQNVGDLHALDLCRYVERRVTCACLLPGESGTPEQLGEAAGSKVRVLRGASGYVLCFSGRRQLYCLRKNLWFCRMLRNRFKAP